MANKFLSRVLATLRAKKEIAALPEFWDAIGRPDLRDVVDLREVANAPNLQSALYEAKRVLAKRRGDAPKEKKHPLTSFIVPSINCHGVASFTYRSFNPTKGWRSTTLDAAEAKLHRDNGGLLLAGLPLRRPGRAPAYRRVA